MTATSSAQEDAEGGWVELGTVSVLGGMLAIVDPSVAGLAGDVWQDMVSDGRASNIVNFGQLPELAPFSAVVLNTGGNGEWVVSALFCPDGDDALRVCAFGVALHEHDGQDGADGGQ